MALAGLVGIAALGRWLSQRSHHPDVPSCPGPSRRPIGAETAAIRPRSCARSSRRSGTASPRTAGSRGETLEERRARVHAKAREAIDSMGDDGPAA